MLGRKHGFVNESGGDIPANHTQDKTFERRVSKSNTVNNTAFGKLIHRIVGV